LLLTLIKSISGIRGTIGGKSGDSLSPFDIIKTCLGFGKWIIENDLPRKVIIGRDARPSGFMITQIVTGSLQSIGIEVVNLGISTTPTVEIAVPIESAGGGIVITASHNPIDWNALKLLNNKGEFLTEDQARDVLENYNNELENFTNVNSIGKYSEKLDFTQKHIDLILNLPLVHSDLIKNCNFKIALDCVNSSGGIVIPRLLQSLGVTVIEKLNCEPNGQFSHNPEPLPEHLTEISNHIKRGDFDLGIAVDPDVDRLAFICEDGSFFGEEYTLVAVADYILSNKTGNTVSNLSSSMALKELTEAYGGVHNASAVGEVHVVEEMKKSKAVIGGEGNGGVIFPELHYGRDALVGIALFLSHLAKSKKKASELRSTYPNYYISKKKMELTPEINVDTILNETALKYSQYQVITIDGVKIDFGKEWVHLRKSNTEPIIRIYAESETESLAHDLANRVIQEIKSIISTKAEQ